MFYFELSVFNTAGLHTKIHSEKFMVPSIFPPGDGIVLEVNPNDLNSNIDIDFAPMQDGVCASWFGFHHHQSVSFEVGIGSTPGLDNVLSFTTVNSSSVCLSGIELREFRRYYTTVKASCSGGQTVSSSDGFVLVNMSSSEELIQVHDGIRCSDEPILEIKNNQSADVDLVTFSEPLDIHKIFTISVAVSNRSIPIIIVSSDVIWTNDGVLHPTDIYRRSFIPLTQFPKFEVDSQSLALTIDIRQCGENMNYSDSLSRYSVYWDVSPEVESFVTLFIASILEDNPDKPYTVRVTPSYKTKTTAHIFQNLNLVNSKKYRAKIDACFGTICIPAVYSTGLLIESIPPIPGKAGVTLGQTYDNCTDVSFDIEPFRCDHSGDAKGYTFDLVTGYLKQRTVTDKIVLTNTASGNLKVCLLSVNFKEF